MDALGSTRLAHLTTQLDNTVEHLAIGATLALATSGWRQRANWPVPGFLLIWVVALAYEFAWQLPLQDAGAWKLVDRLLDAGEWAAGAALVEAIFFVVPLGAILSGRYWPATPLLRPGQLPDRRVRGA